MTDGSPTTVLIDALACRPGQGGILRHGVGVVRALAARNDLRVFVLTGAPEVFGSTEGAEFLVAPPWTESFLLRALWREAVIGRRVRSSRADILLSLTPELPFRGTAVPAVMVLHDVAPLVAPALYSRTKRLRFRLLLPAAVARATRVVCVSRATLLDLHRWTGIDPERCAVIGNAAEVRPRPAQLPAEGDPTCAVEPYVLAVGSIYSNKNTGTVLKALSLLSSNERLGEAHLAGCPKLILVGPLSRSDKQRLEKDIAALDLEGLVEHRGYAAQADLDQLYAEASALIFPSVYEGQGIPVMEAVGFEIPVLATDLPSIREFADSRVTLVDEPLNPARWAEEILRAVTARRAEERRGDPSMVMPTWRAIGREFAELLGSTVRRSRDRTVSE